MSGKQVRAAGHVAGDPLIMRDPVGSVVDTDSGPWGLATATFDDSRAHRYRLSRVWGESGPRVNFLMLNPSTADAFQLDPTVRRCVGYAQAWGAGSLEVTNIFSYRSTDPKALRSAQDPVGVGNDQAIVSAATAADIVVLAWGTHGSLEGRGKAVIALLRGAGVKLNTLKMTSAGHPGHPLYLPGSAVLTPYPY